VPERKRHRFEGVLARLDRDLGRERDTVGIRHGRNPGDLHEGRPARREDGHRQERAADRRPVRRRHDANRLGRCHPEDREGGSRRAAAIVDDEGHDVGAQRERCRDGVFGETGREAPAIGAAVHRDERDRRGEVEIEPDRGRDHRIAVPRPDERDGRRRGIARHFEERAAAVSGRIERVDLDTVPSFTEHDLGDREAPPRDEGLTGADLEMVLVEDAVAERAEERGEVLRVLRIAVRGRTADRNDVAGDDRAAGGGYDVDLRSLLIDQQADRVAGAVVAGIEIDESLLRAGRGGHDCDEGERHKCRDQHDAHRVGSEASETSAGRAAHIGPPPIWSVNIAKPFGAKSVGRISAAAPGASARPEISEASSEIGRNGALSEKTGN